MKKIIITLGIMLAGSTLKAQSQNLTVGDAVPELHLAPLVNYPTGALEPSTLQNKILIIDFWSTSCGGCVTSMPHLQELQDRFGDTIQIVLVSPESEAVINSFFKKKQQFLAGFRLPIVAQDTLLSQLFPSGGIPHLVWIGKDKLIKAITDSRQLTMQNLSALLAKGTIRLPVKRYFTTEEQMDVLQVLGQVTPGMLKRYSFFSSPIDGLGGLSHRYKDGAVHVMMRNCRPLNMYLYAYRYDTKTLHFGMRHQVLYEVKDKSRFTGFDSIRNGAVTYYYDMCTPVKNFKTRYQETADIIKMELDQFFGVKSSLIHKKVPCLVIKERKQKQPKPADAGDVLPIRDSMMASGISGREMADLFQEYGQPGMHIVYEGKPDYQSFRFKPGIGLAGIRELLASYGFETEIAERELEFLLLKEE